MRFQKEKEIKLSDTGKKLKPITFFEGCHELCYLGRALKSSNDYVVFMTSTFFHFALRRDTGCAVSRSSEEERDITES